MQNPRLKASFQLIPNERILVDRETGRRFQLTQGQTHISFLLDGTRGAADLRAEFLKRGVDVQVADIERQIAFLASLGALEGQVAVSGPAPQPTAPPPPPRPPAPQQPHPVAQQAPSSRPPQPGAQQLAPPNPPQPASPREPVPAPTQANPAYQPVVLQTSAVAPARAPGATQQVRVSQLPTNVMTAQQVLSELTLKSPPTSGATLGAELGLEPPRPSTPSLAAVAPLEPGDRVPLFRTDLKLRRTAGGAPGVVEVEDPATGRAFKLYDFELSIARMLNGERRVSEVLEASTRLGLPATLDSFQKFIRQLQQYGFIAAAGGAPAAAAPDGTFPARQEWDPGVRELFVSGVRMLRQGKLTEAKEYFTALLEIDPANTEAREMLSLVEARSLAPASPGATAPPSADGTFDPATLDADAQPAEGAEELPIVQATDEEVVPPAPPSRWKLRVRRWVPRLIVLGALAGVAQVRVPLNVSAECQLVAANRDVVRAASGGFVREVLVTQGQAVEKGAEVARLSSSDLEKQLERREAEVAQAQSELDLITKGARPEEVGRAKAVLAGRLESWRAAKKEYARITELFDRKHASAEELSKAEERVTSTHSAVLEASAQLKLIGAGARPEEVAKRQAELRARVADRDLSRAELKAATLSAPIAGIVTTANLREKVGMRLEPGAVLLEIEDMHTMRVIARVAESDLDLVERGQRASVKVSNLPTRVFEGEVTFISPIIEEEAATGARFFRIETVIQNDEGLLKPNLSGFTKLHAGERPLWRILTRGLVRWLRLRFLF